MAWRNQPRLDERVYVGTCPMCGEVKIHKKHQGKSIYCSDCGVWIRDASLMSFSLAVTMKNKK